MGNGIDNHITGKILTTLFLLTLSFVLFAQNKIAGHYGNHFGNQIQLNDDSTFKYTWHFDLSGGWAKGTWSINNDTIYFNMLPIYDTLSYINNDGSADDRLVLAVHEKAERLTPYQYVNRGISSGMQDLQACPDKLFFKHQKLYKIKNGKLVKKKIRGFWTGEKWNPWFFKIED
jgi:hypothetical protein